MAGIEVHIHEPHPQWLQSTTPAQLVLFFLCYYSVCFILIHTQLFNSTYHITAVKVHNCNIVVYECSIYI